MPSLAEQLPATLKSIEQELAEAQKRLDHLKYVRECLMVVQNCHPAFFTFEAVTPEEQPSSKRGMVVSGPTATACVETTRRLTSGSHARTHVFLSTADGNISIAISPKDIPQFENIGLVDQDVSPRYRVVWTNTERGAARLS